MWEPPIFRIIDSKVDRRSHRRTFLVTNYQTHAACKVRPLYQRRRLMWTGNQRSSYPGRFGRVMEVESRSAAKTDSNR